MGTVLSGTALSGQALWGVDIYELTRNSAMSLLDANYCCFFLRTDIKKP